MRTIFLIAFAAVSVAACSDDDAESTALAAPTITEAFPMSDGVHLTWENNQKDCDSIEGERKSGADAYAVAFTTPGSADNKHDGSLTKGTTYSYRLRCKKGSAYSPYSNEMTGTPQ